MAATKKKTTRKTSTRTTRTAGRRKKTGEASTKEAIASIDANIAGIEKREDSGGTPAKKSGGRRKPAGSRSDQKKAKATSGGESKPPKKEKALSALDAAALVLKDSKEPLGTKEMIAEMAKRKLWTSSAATPWATLYSGILREIQKQGKQARFRKVERGRFAATTAAAPRKKGA